MTSCSSASGRCHATATSAQSRARSWSRGTSGSPRPASGRTGGGPAPPEDLMQVGYVGLLKAINNFDPSFGSSLSAYAAPCVSGEIKRHFRDKRWQVHVRRSAQELLLELRKATENLTHTLGRQPNDEELIERLGCTSADLLEARQADMVFSAYSLDAP